MKPSGLGYGHVLSLSPITPFMEYHGWVGKQSETDEKKAIK